MIDDSRQSTCRLCMSQDGVFLDLFGSEAQNTSYADDVNKCLSFEVKEGDGLSTKICIKCVGLLGDCRPFVEKVVQSGTFKNELPVSDDTCFYCLSAENYLFPIPEASVTKTKDCFNSQIPLKVKICHRCQFHLDTLHELKSKACSALKQFYGDSISPKKTKNPKREDSVDEIVHSLKKKFTMVQHKEKSLKEISVRLLDVGIAFGPDFFSKGTVNVNQFFKALSNFETRAGFKFKAGPLSSKSKENFSKGRSPSEKDEKKKRERILLKDEKSPKKEKTEERTSSNEDELRSSFNKTKGEDSSQEEDNKSQKNAKISKKRKGRKINPLQEEDDEPSKTEVKNSKKDKEKIKDSSSDEDKHVAKEEKSSKKNKEKFKNSAQELFKIIDTTMKKNKKKDEDSTQEEHSESHKNEEKTSRKNEESAKENCQTSLSSTVDGDAGEPEVKPNKVREKSPRKSKNSSVTKSDDTEGNSSAKRRLSDVSESKTGDEQASSESVPKRSRMLSSSSSDGSGQMKPPARQKPTSKTPNRNSANKNASSAVPDSPGEKNTSVTSGCDKENEGPKKRKRGSTSKGTDYSKFFDDEDPDDSGSDAKKTKHQQPSDEDCNVDLSTPVVSKSRGRKSKPCVDSQPDLMIGIDELMKETPKSTFKPFICSVCHEGYVSTTKGKLHKLVMHDPRSKLYIDVKRCDEDEDACFWRVGGPETSLKHLEESEASQNQAEDPEASSLKAVEPEASSIEAEEPEASLQSNEKPPVSLKNTEEPEHSLKQTEIPKVNGNDMQGESKDSDDELFIDENPEQREPNNLNDAFDSLFKGSSTEEASEERGKSSHNTESEIKTVNDQKPTGDSTKETSVSNGEAEDVNNKANEDNEEVEDKIASTEVDKANDESEDMEVENLEVSAENTNDKEARISSNNDEGGQEKKVQEEDVGTHEEDTTLEDTDKGNNIETSEGIDTESRSENTLANDTQAKSGSNEEKEPVLNAVSPTSPCSKSECEDGKTPENDSDEPGKDIATAEPAATNETGSESITKNDTVGDHERTTGIIVEADQPNNVTAANGSTVEGLESISSEEEDYDGDSSKDIVQESSHQDTLVH